MFTGPDLAEQRKRFGISQEELAAEMGLTRQSISSIENRALVRDARSVQYLAAVQSIVARRDVRTDRPARSTSDPEE